MSINKNNTLFILDWDDTLYPTSWFSNNKIELIDFFFNTDKYKLLDESLFTLLYNLSTLGSIIIVTNALLEWINFSSQILPKTQSILNNIKIISARQQYGHMTRNTSDWKKLAFISIVTDKFVNIISIGDNASYEYQALINLKNYHPQKLLKSIRFINYNDISYHIIKNNFFNVIVDQINTLNNAIKYLAYTPKNLDMTFKTI